MALPPPLVLDGAPQPPRVVDSPRLERKQSGNLSPVADAKKRLSLDDVTSNTDTNIVQRERIQTFSRSGSTSARGSTDIPLPLAPLPPAIDGTANEAPLSPLPAPLASSLPPLKLPSLPLPGLPPPSSPPSKQPPPTPTSLPLSSPLPSLPPGTPPPATPPPSSPRPSAPPPEVPHSIASSSPSLPPPPPEHSDSSGSVGSDPGSSKKRTVKRQKSEPKPKKIKSASHSGAIPGITPGTPPPLPAALPGTTPVPGSPAGATKNEEQRMERRKKIATEINDTETSYVSSLQVIFDLIIKPLKAEIANGKKPWFDKEQLDDLNPFFSTWETLLMCHISFSDQLKKTMSTWTDTSKLGEAVLENAKFIKLYRHYVNSFDKLLATITQCIGKVKAFKKFVADFEAREEARGLTLQAMLIMPVQRIPRYVMLVTDLLKNTLDDHPDYSTLTESLELMRAFADFINKSKALAENKDKIDQVKSKFTETGGFDLEALLKGQKLVKEGECVVKDTKSGKSNEAFVFLLTNTLLLGKLIKKGEYKLYDTVRLVAALNADADKKEFLLDVTAGKYFMKFASSTTEKEFNDWKTKLQAQIKETVQLMLQGEDHITDRDESIDDPGLSEDAKMKNFLVRRKIAEEIIQKEDEYTKRLEAISTWIEALKKQDNKDLITRDELSSVFANLEDLYKVHVDVLSLLKKRMADWDANNSLGDIFCDKLEYYRLYRQFILMHPQMNGTLQNVLFRKPLFVISLNTWEKQQNNGLKIETTFDLPVRRLESLNAQLLDLLRNTPKEHPDFKNLIRATKAMKERDDELKKLSGQSGAGGDTDKPGQRQRSWSSSVASGKR